MDIEQITIKVKIMSDRLSDEGKIQAMIILDFGLFKIKGFRIRESKFENRRGQKLWLLPPSYVAGGHYHPIFYMEDKKQWEKLEDRIYDAFDEEFIKYAADQIDS